MNSKTMLGLVTFTPKIHIARNAIVSIEAFHTEPVSIVQTTLGKISVPLPVEQVTEIVLAFDQGVTSVAERQKKLLSYVRKVVARFDMARAFQYYQDEKGQVLGYDNAEAFHHGQAAGVAALDTVQLSALEKFRDWPDQIKMFDEEEFGCWKLTGFCFDAEEHLCMFHYR